MRARNLKPGFFRNECLSSLDPLVRLLFAGLWCLADREGRLEDWLGKIKIEVLPGDDCDVDRMLEDLARPQGPDGERFIRCYAVGGRRCIQVLNFIRHQNPHIREVASLLPAPPAEADATQWASDALVLHRKSTVLVAKEHQASPADSLIPDSLIADSLIADS
ncbi:MAG: phage replication protein, partial [bacterium]